MKLIGKSIQIYLMQVLCDTGGFTRNDDAKKWQNQHAFILDWTKRSNGEKVTKLYGKTKGSKLL